MDAWDEIRKKSIAKQDCGNNAPAFGSVTIRNCHYAMTKMFNKVDGSRSRVIMILALFVRWFYLPHVLPGFGVNGN